MLVEHFGNQKVVWEDGRMNRLVDGWVAVKAVLRIAYSNQWAKNVPIFKIWIANFFKVKKSPIPHCPLTPLPTVLGASLVSNLFNLALGSMLHYGQHSSCAVAKCCPRLQDWFFVELRSMTSCVHIKHMRFNLFGLCFPFTWLRFWKVHAKPVFKFVWLRTFQWIVVASLIPMAQKRSHL